jgi:uncharacterized membrane protein YeaQ/YmgE (transglycosylase-associated protein family)
MRARIVPCNKERMTLLFHREVATHYERAFCRMQYRDFVALHFEKPAQSRRSFSTPAANCICTLPRYDCLIAYIKEVTPMNLTSLLWFLLIGICAGWLAGQLMKGSGFGLVVDMIVGVIGSFLGGWLFSVLGIGVGGGALGALLVATVGAIVLLILLRLIKRA